MHSATSDPHPYTFAFFHSYTLPLPHSTQKNFLFPILLLINNITMSTSVQTANWRFVELGRVVLIDNSKLATIVEIIDQKRVCFS